MDSLGDMMEAVQAHALETMRHRSAEMDRLAARAIFLHPGRADEMFWADVGFDPEHPENLPGIACRWPRQGHDGPVNLFGGH